MSKAILKDKNNEEFKAPPSFENHILPDELIKILDEFKKLGGRGIIVGGYVRDIFLNRISKDIDVEVFGLPLAIVEKTLKKFGPVEEVGKSFGVLLYKNLDIDFSLPRKETFTGDIKKPKHKDFAVETDPTLTFKQAALRRDLTINSIGWDPTNQILLDPHGGVSDLNNEILRATDKTRFSEDPLRALRVMQFASRFDFKIDSGLMNICRQQNLSQLSGERIREEWFKLLLHAKKPSTGLNFLKDSGLLKYFPEIEALIGVQQSPIHHPEGDVWIHTLMVLDEAALLRKNVMSEENTQYNLALMLGALCHDFGKALCTEKVIQEDGTIHYKAHGHDNAGVKPTLEFLTRLKCSHDLINKVTCLVAEHLMPYQLVGRKGKNSAGAKAYRKLFRRISKDNVSLELLIALADADQQGRTPPACNGPKASEVFFQACEHLGVLHGNEEPNIQDIVLGRHLIELGLKPGPEFKNILEKCRDIQDEFGMTEVEDILKKAELQ